MNVIIPITAAILSSLLTLTLVSKLRIKQLNNSIKKQSEMIDKLAKQNKWIKEAVRRFEYNNSVSIIEL